MAALALVAVASGAAAGNNQEGAGPHSIQQTAVLAKQSWIRVDANIRMLS